MIDTMPRYNSGSTNKLRFMQPQEFEDEAIQLLAEYGNKHGLVTAPPIPIDEIVELYLELNLEFLDMQAEFGVDDIHGALWVNDRRVGVDIGLDPAENPSRLGRYHFTLAHETGHWRLHRQLFFRNANQLSLMPEDKPRPEYICRSSDKTPIEYQADQFAACLLMPKEMVKREWFAWRGTMDPIYLDDLVSDPDVMLVREQVGRSGYLSQDKSQDNLLFEIACKPFAERFSVSAEAMRIRLETLKFLFKNRENLLF
jgi:hypothetical protein